MIVYHGTADESFIASEMKQGTWLAGHRFHAFRIAERRSKRGGSPIVVEIDTGSLDREEGRENPTYRFSGGSYKVLAVHRMDRVEVK